MARYTSRVAWKRYQLHLPFPPHNVLTPGEFKAAQRKLRRKLLEQRQPRFFPPGWHAMSVADPNWRETYIANWIAKRDAAGLPSDVIDQRWFAKRKRA